MSTFTLYWAWADSTQHTERKAVYDSLDAARAQADHDLARAKAEQDFTAAPLRIEDADGEVVWESDLESETTPETETGTEGG